MRRLFPHILVAGTLLAGAVACAAIGERTYFWYVGEDGFVETVSVFLFAGAFVYALRARAALFRAGETLLGPLFLIAAIGLALIIGEEISWGQRLFQWATPESFVHTNVQGETNLHNIEGVHQTVGMAQLLVGLYGTVLPFLVLRLRPGKVRHLLDGIVPAVRFLPYFLPLLGWRIVRLLVTLPEANRYAIVQINEVLECILAAGMMMFFRDAWHRARSEPDDEPSAGADHLPGEQHPAPARRTVAAFDHGAQ